MAIIAKYANRFDVEVVDTLTTGDHRTLALVTALEGEPFTRFSMGGPVTQASAFVSPDYLSDIHQEPEPDVDPLGEFFQNEPDYGDFDDIDPRADLYAIQ